MKREEVLVRLVKLAMMPGQAVTISPEAASMLNDWWNSFDSNKDSAARVLELIKQVLTVLAVVNAPRITRVHP